MELYGPFGLTPLSRRQVLQRGAAAALARAARARSRTIPIGIQLYTVRDLLVSAPADTLKSITEIGFHDVELMRADLPKLAPLFQQYGIRPITATVETALITGNRELWNELNKTVLNAPPIPDQLTLEEALEDIKRHDVKFAILSYLHPQERGGVDVMRRYAREMNRAGEICRKLGLGFCFHNHAFEFGGNPGERPIDVLLRECDPQLVGWEMDVFWASVAGNDPAALIAEHRDRVRLLHLKDKATGTPVMQREGVPRSAFKELGNGVLDFAAILRAAQSARVEYAFVEQDWTPGNPLDSLRQSYRHLRSLRLV